MHVDGAVEALQHHADRGAVAGRHQRDRGLRQVGLAQALGQRGVDRARRAIAVGAAAQDHGVAGLERQRAGVGGDVRPALVDDADDADRHAHALDGHAVRPRPGFGDLADRVGQLAHHVEALGHGLDALVVRASSRSRNEPVRPAALPSATSSALAARISALPARIAAAMAASARSFCAVEASASTRAAALARRPIVAHGRGDVARSLDGLQRRGHGAASFAQSVHFDALLSRSSAGWEGH